MHTYVIDQTLTPVAHAPQGEQYPVYLMDRREWGERKEALFDDAALISDPEESTITRAETFGDAICLYVVAPLTHHTARFALFITAKSVVIVDDSGTAGDILAEIVRTVRPQRPGVERFLYDFLDKLVRGEREELSRLEKQLDALEGQALAGHLDGFPQALTHARHRVRALHRYYAQLVEVAQELEENENGFFKKEHLRYFALFEKRMAHHEQSALALTDMCRQLRELEAAQRDAYQNQVIRTLTVLSTVCFPLTLITGWFGMNFVHMPELQSPYAYPAVIVLSMTLISVLILWLRRKKIL